MESASLTRLMKQDAAIWDQHTKAVLELGATLAPDDPVEEAESAARQERHERLAARLWSDVEEADRGGDA